MAKRILIIEDDLEIVGLLKMSCGELGYELDTANDGESGLNKAQSNTYALVITDINLPKLSGFEICKRLRMTNEDVPIVVLTSRVDEVDRVLGLEFGADDYVIKPFSLRELTARIKAHLRRSEARSRTALLPESESRLIFGELEIDLVKRRVLMGKSEIILTAREFDLLVFLASNPGKPFTRDELREHIWGYQSTGYEPTLTTHLSRLRSKIEPIPSQPKYIKTVHGVGYRFAEPSEL